MSLTSSKSEYIDVLFPFFESDLKEKLVENAILKEVKAGDLLMQTGQYFRSTILF